MCVSSSVSMFCRLLCVCAPHMRSSWGGLLQGVCTPPACTRTTQLVLVSFWHSHAALALLCRWLASCTSPALQGMAAAGPQSRLAPRSECTAACWGVCTRWAGWVPPSSCGNRWHITCSAAGYSALPPSACCLRRCQPYHMVVPRHRRSPAVSWEATRMFCCWL